MSQATIYYRRAVVDGQEYGSNDEYMVSRIFFDMLVDGKRHENLYSDVKQTVGAEFEKAPLEVTRPVGLKGAFNYEAFRQETESYYRNLFGKTGRAVRTANGCSVRVRNCLFEIPKTVQISFDNLTGNAW